MMDADGALDRRSGDASFRRGSGSRAHHRRVFYTGPLRFGSPLKLTWQGCQLPDMRSDEVDAAISFSRFVPSG